MPSTKAIAGQTWVDLALQELCDEERIFELCDLNGASMTDDIAPGTEVITPVAESKKGACVLTLRSRRPASLFFGVGNAAPEGIGYWAIETDFVIS